MILGTKIHIILSARLRMCVCVWYWVWRNNDREAARINDIDCRCSRFCLLSFGFNGIAMLFGECMLYALLVDWVREIYLFYFSSHTSSRWWFGSAASESSRRLSLMPHSALARPKERFKLLISFLFDCSTLYGTHARGAGVGRRTLTQENKRFKTLDQKVIQNARSKMPYSPWIYILPSFIISVYLTWANHTVAERTHVRRDIFIGGWIVGRAND